MAESIEKSALEKMVSENQKLREEIYELRKQRQQKARTIRKLEGQIKSFQLKLSAVEGENKKQVSEVRRFMENLDTEKKQKIKLLTELSENRNMVTRKDADLVKLNADLNRLMIENEDLKKERELGKSLEVNALKQKQSSANSIKVLETKLEALQIQKKFQASKILQLEQELGRNKDELQEISKKYHEKQIGVQAIYRDDQQTKQKLLLEFQHKISDKDQQNKNQLEFYLTENSMLKTEIIQLKNLLTHH